MPGGSPNAWEQRYYRTGENSGLGVWLVSRVAGRGQWVVLLPDRSLALGTISHRVTYAPRPVGGVLYESAAVVTAADKRDAENRARTALQTPDRMRALGMYQRERAAPARVALASVLAMGSFPKTLFKGLRWCISSRRHFVAGIGIVYLMDLTTRSMGVYDRIYAGFSYVGAWVQAAKDNFIAMGENAAEWAEWTDAWTTWIEQYFSLANAVGIFFAMVAIMYGTAHFWLGEDDSESQAGTPPPSDEEGIQDERPSLSPRDVNESLVMQQSILGDLLEAQRSMREELSEHQMSVRVGELRRSAEEKQRGDQ